jgi:hypothetical protein
VAHALDEEITMSFRFSYFTCTILAAGLVVAVGGNLQAEEFKQDHTVKTVNCGGCTDAGPACGDSGCANADAGCGSACGNAGCDSGCNSGGGLFGGRGKHSWRHADCGNSCGGNSCGGGGLLGHGGGCRGGGRNTIEGLDPHFNCGCNGSYNFPVPPLSTYMWPGMYKHQLMTEYDNPWRFPPIKAYTDEPADMLPEEFRKNYPEKARPPVIDLEEQVSLPRAGSIRSVSHRQAMPMRNYSGEETMSQKMERYYSSSAR